MSNIIKRAIFSTDEDGILGYCVNWTAENALNSRMFLDGYIDFTEILAGRFISIGSSAGTITRYLINGNYVNSSIEMTFTSKIGRFYDNSLVVVPNECLSGIEFYVEIVCTNASEIFIEGGAFAIEIPNATSYSYNNCN